MHTSRHMQTDGLSKQSHSHLQEPSGFLISFTAGIWLFTDKAVITIEWFLEWQNIQWESFIERERERALPHKGWPHLRGMRCSELRLRLSCGYCALCTVVVPHQIGFPHTTTFPRPLYIPVQVFIRSQVLMYRLLHLYLRSQSPPVSYQNVGQTT